MDLNDIALIVFFGLVILVELIALALVVIYRQNLPFIPRKYYKTKIYSKSGLLIKETKAWKVTKNKIPYLRVLLGGGLAIPPWVGVEKDVATLQGIDEKGELLLVEQIPDLREASNYILQTPPITQVEKAQRDIYEEIIIPAATIRYRDESGEEKIGVDTTQANILLTKLKNIFSTNSRLADLNISEARKQYMQQARREMERSINDSILLKYGPIMGIIITALFCFLMVDSTNKATQTITDRIVTVEQDGFSQIIQQCGGVYTPPLKNVTSQQPSGGLGLPFLG